MGLASKVEDMKDLDAAARKRELDELVLQQQNAKKEEARKLAEQAKRYALPPVLPSFLPPFLGSNLGGREGRGRMPSRPQSFNIFSSLPSSLFPSLPPSLQFGLRRARPPPA